VIKWCDVITSRTDGSGIVTTPIIGIFCCRQPGF
jgi:hypothetical protein